MFTKTLARSLRLAPAIAGTALFAIGMLANGPAAHADVLVNVNMSSGAYSAPTGTAGALVAGQMQWNNFNVGASTTLSNLIDTNGTTTGISVAVSGFNGGYHQNSSTGVNAMLYTYPSSKTPSATVTLSGLDATGATTYNLYVYNWWAWSGSGATTSITEAGGTLPAAQSNNYTGTISSEGTTFTQGVNYALFKGLTANASGTIQAVSLGSYGAQFNGLQLDAVSTPEPATLGILGAGAMGLLLLRKRKTA